MVEPTPVRHVETGTIHFEVCRCPLAGGSDSFVVMRDSHGDRIAWPLARYEAEFVAVIRISDIPPTAIAFFGEQPTIVWNEGKSLWVAGDRLTDQRSTAERMTVAEACRRFRNPPMNGAMYHLEKP